MTVRRWLVLNVMCHHMCEDTLLHHDSLMNHCMRNEGVFNFWGMASVTSIWSYSYAIIPLYVAVEFPKDACSWFKVQYKWYAPVSSCLSGMLFLERLAYFVGRVGSNFIVSAIPVWKWVVLQKPLPGHLRFAVYMTHDVRHNVPCYEERKLKESRDLPPGYMDYNQVTIVFRLFTWTLS